ncbi:MAG: RlpA-like double-psi beta-barrel domain-containing protein, partial [Actinomycetota bacterium]
LDNRIYRAGKDIAGGEREAAELQSEIRSAEAKTGELEEKIRQTTKTLNARAASIYKHGPSSILAPLFTARSWSELMRQPVIWRNLALMDGKIVLESTRLKEELAARRSELARSSENIKERNAQLDDARDRLTAVRRERQGSLGKLRAAIQEAMAAEKAVMAARAAAVKKAPAVCVPGSPDRDRKLQTLLDWYAPATGPAGFLPPKLSATGVVTNGSASWYGPGFDGCRSSSGATFRASQMTAASLSLPLGTLLKATSGGRSAVVVITDRGPYVAGRDLDLSKAAAQAIGIGGVGPVSMEILLPAEPAPAFP